MSVRHAKLRDIEALGELLDGYRVFYDQPSDPAGARDFLAHRLGLGDSHLLVYEGEDGELLGFVQLYPLFSTVRLAPLWLLNDLFVAPNARDRGIGRALMNAARDLALANGAEIVIFPELSLTGYEPELASDLATTADDHRLELFQQIADSRQITVGVGLPIKNSNGIAIGMPLIQPRQPRQIYAKQYLHADEERARVGHHRDVPRGSGDRAHRVGGQDLRAGHVHLHGCAAHVRGRRRGGFGRSCGRGACHQPGSVTAPFRGLSTFEGLKSGA